VTTNERIPVAVIGVGHLGSRHARIYSSLPQVELIGVADIDEKRAEQVGQSYGTGAVADYRRLIPRIRAASVAVPTVDHHSIALALIGAGVDVLVEKPIAATEGQARELVEAAQSGGRILAVGHTERYNPAVTALLELSSHPRFIEVHRLGAFTARSLDIDAVLDLMIHDLDIVASLLRSEVASIDAVGVPVLTEKVDIANARIRFESGCVANLTASRISQEKIRKLRVWERERYVSVDYFNQEALCYQLIRKQGQEPEIERRPLTVEQQEPLKLELEDFVEAVRKRSRPVVTGADGLRALQLAIRVLAAMEDSRLPV
jgi:predicted dehydrogenase